MSTFGEVVSGVGVYNSSLSGNLYKYAAGKPSKVTINLPVIIIGALIFTIILSWFEFIRITYDEIFPTKDRKLTPIAQRYENIIVRLIYSIFITSLCVLLIIACLIFIQEKKGRLIEPVKSQNE